MLHYMFWKVEEQTEICIYAYMLHTYILIFLIKHNEKTQLSIY